MSPGSAKAVTSMSTRRLAVAAFAASVAAACFGGGGGGSGQPNPTLMSVEPRAFLGDVPCDTGAGSARLYVATLTDVTANTDGGTGERFTLASSGPVSCNRVVTFGFVVPGHEYVAEVDVYDRTDVRPLGTAADNGCRGAGCAATGSRVMLDPDGNVLEPRWTTRCGDPDAEPRSANAPTESLEFFTRPVRGCEPLVNDSAEPGTVRVSTGALLGGLTCGEEAGSVASVSVRAELSGAAAVEVACGETAELSDVPPGPVKLRITAREAGSSSARWGATCSAVVRAGVSVAASCDTLTDRGELTIDVAALLSSVGASCGVDSVGTVTASLTSADGVSSRGPEACSASLRFTGLPPGPVDVTLATTLSDGGPGPGGRCEALVEPGRVAAADCVAVAALGE